MKDMNKRILDSFLSRSIYDSEEAVITAALRALVREQMTKEAEQRKEFELNDKAGTCGFCSEPCNNNWCPKDEK